MILNMKVNKQPVYFVVERNGRYLVVRHLSNTEPLIVEDCRTKVFAEMCCENYNSKERQ